MKEHCTDCRTSGEKGKIAVMAVVLTIISVFISLLVTGLRTAKIAKKTQLKDVLRKLFPGYDWEFTGRYVHLRQLKYRIYCPAGFQMEYPKAEQMLRAELLANTPQLAKLKLEIEFLPLSEFPGFAQPEETEEEESVTTG